MLVRNAPFRRGNLPPPGAGTNWAELDAESGWDAPRWQEAIQEYLAEHDEIGTGVSACGPQFLQIEQMPDKWLVKQVFEDPEGDHDWRIEAEVDLAASDEAGVAVVRVLDVGTF